MKNKSNLNLSLRKVLLSALVAAPLVTSPVQLRALPGTTGNVTSNSAATVFSAVGTTLNITDTSTNRLVLKWGQFGAPGNTISLGETVRYNLSSASAAVLNMVSTGATLVEGTLSSNGQILILNANGITIGATGVVNASGFTVSTIPEAEFQFLSSGSLGYFGTATNDVTVTSGAAISVGSSGSVFLAGRAVNVAGAVDASTLGVTAQNNAVTLGSGGALTVGLASGAIGVFGTAVDSYGNLTVSSGGGAVNLSANAVTLNGNSASITSGGGAVTAPSALRIGLGGSDDGATVTVNSGAGAVTLSNLAANNNRRVNVALTSSQAAITALGTSELRLNASTITYSGGGDALTLAGARAISSGGDTSFGGTNKNISLTSTGGANLASLSFSGNGDLVFTTLSQAGATNSTVTLTSKTGSVSLPAITLTGSGSITVTAATNIVQTAALAAGSATGTFEAVSGSVTLTMANDLNNLVLKNSPSGFTYVDANALTIANNTNLVGAGNVTSGGALTFAGNVRFQSTLAATATNANITDTTNNLVIDGALTLNAGTGTVILDGSAGNGVGLGNRYGQINVTQADGGVRIYETTTLNLGNITTIGTLRAWSSAGDVVNNGAIAATLGVQVGAGTAVAPGNVTLSNTSNSFGTGLVILDDFTVLANTSTFGAPGTGGDPIGTLLARDLTIASNVAFTLGTLAATNGSGIAGNLNITAASGGITLSGQTVAAGSLTLNAPGDITATNGSNSFGVVNVTSQGVVSVTSASALTVNATLTGAGNANFTASGAALRIGTVTSDRSTGTVTFTTSGNNTITDTVAGIRIFGPVNFTSGGGITINRAGHSFGLVGVSTGSNQSATIVESGTLRLGTVLLTNTGSFTATSTTGDIVQDTTAGGIRFGNNASTATMTATLNAPAGNIVLDDAADNRIPRLVATAAANVLLSNTRATALGNITAGGTLTISAGANTISQVSSTRLNVFDTVTLSTTGANDITITNTGNRLGGVSLTSGSGNIAITENTTLNLKSVNTTGTFAAISESGSIIDSSDSNVTNNNVGGAAVLGAATFTAANGNITLGLSGSNYNTVGFTTGGNVSLLDGAGNLTLSASTIGGTLDVIATTASAALSQSGALNVTGNVSLTTNAGNIDLSNGANQLGAVRFTANQVNLAESTSLNLRAGSVATGAVQLSTSANFVTSGSGASSFTNNLTISAGGTIIPGAGSLLVVGTFTVFSNSTKDLSALSKSGNLTNKDPINLGSGTYIPPGP